MEITREHLREAADAVLRFFEKKNITSLQDIARINYILHVVDGAKGTIYVQKIPSNLGTIAQAVSYVLPCDNDVPIDIKMNKELDYSQVILKTILLIPDYKLFSEDRFGNMRQFKMIHSTNLADVIIELEKLVFKNED